MPVDPVPSPTPAVPTAVPAPAPTGAPTGAPAGAPTAVRRPLLAPALRRLWRDPQTLQLGWAPAGVPHPAWVLSGLDPATRGALAALDGTRDTAQVVRVAASLGCPPGRALHQLRLLDDAGLLEDAAEPGPLAGLPLAERERLAPDLAAHRALGQQGAEALARRLAARVRVVGAGRVGGPLATLLSASGAGAVDLVDGGGARPGDACPGGVAVGDAGRRRDEALADRASATASGGLRPTAGIGGRPDVVVLAPVAGLTGADLAAVPPGVPHLLVEVRDTVGTVGPLVVPGSTACLRCLDLARSDLDPGWPAVAAQLQADPWGDGPSDTALAVAVASQAALQVTALLDGRATPAAAGGTLELALPDWRWRRRSWVPHPDCGCTTAEVRPA